jgi:hypothetical protein
MKEQIYVDKTIYELPSWPACHLCVVAEHPCQQVAGHQCAQVAGYWLEWVDQCGLVSLDQAPG